jgi:hypothetical protein
MGTPFIPLKAMILGLFALAACQEAVPAGDDRATLLARLQHVLPASESNDTDAVRTGFAGFEAQMIAVNPGRDNEIAAILNEYAACISFGLRAAAPRLVITAVDASLTDAEIEELIAFYSGPDRARFVSLETRERAGETLSDDERGFLEGYRNSSVARKFSTAMAETARAFPATEEGREIIGACTLRMRSAFGRAELVLP